MTTIKFNDVTFETLNTDLVVEKTNVGTGVFRRHILALEIVSENVGKTMPAKELKHKLAVANMIAFPNQKTESHTLWAGKCFSGWKKLGIIETAA